MSLVGRLWAGQVDRHGQAAVEAACPPRHDRNQLYLIHLHSYSTLLDSWTGSLEEASVRPASITPRIALSFSHSSCPPVHTSVTDGIHRSYGGHEQIALPVHSLSTGVWHNA